MAGDWLKFEKATSDKPEVYAMADRLKIDPDAIVGKLLRVWGWFDSHTEAGNAPGVTCALLDRLASVSGFADAMLSVGWLSRAGDGFTLPNFDRHNGQTAKKRSLTSKRVAVHRAKSNGAGVTSALAREEKNREEKNNQAEGGGAAAAPSLEGLADDDSPGLVQFPCVGRGQVFHLHEKFLSELRQLYPTLDPLAEAKLALAKIQSGAVSRKTAKGMPRFLFSWMDRASNHTRPVNGHVTNGRRATFA